MVFRTKLTPSVDKHATDLTLYRQIIVSLLYLTTNMIDIMFTVVCCARYQVNQRELHMTVVKNIFRYLKRTTSLGFWYPTEFGFFVQAYFDADLGGYGVDRKITTSGC